MRFMGIHRSRRVGCLIAAVAVLIFIAFTFLISMSRTGGVLDRGSMDFAEDSRGGDDGGDDENSPTSFA